MEKIIWYLPVLFMIHDFEEIIFMRTWINRNKTELLQKYPLLGKRVLSMTGNLSTEGFSFAVLLIFLLLSGVCWISLLTGNYIVWVALFMVFYLHLFMHIGQALALRRYIPALATSLIFVGVFTFLFQTIVEFYSIKLILISTLIGIAAAVPVFLGITKFAGWVDKTLIKKSAGKSITHVAIWTKDLERLKNFYCKYFNATPGARYINSARQFESYFLIFRDNSCNLEIMHKPVLLEAGDKNKKTGYAHIAISVNSREQVDFLTTQIGTDGYTIISNPRVTGDGYYESVVADPDGNLVEITV